MRQRDAALLFLLFCCNQKAGAGRRCACDARVRVVAGSAGRRKCAAQTQKCANMPPTLRHFSLSPPPVFATPPADAALSRLSPTRRVFTDYAITLMAIVYARAFCCRYAFEKDHHAPCCRCMLQIISPMPFSSLLSFRASFLHGCPLIFSCRYFFEYYYIIFISYFLRHIACYTAPLFSTESFLQIFFFSAREPTRFLRRYHFHYRRCRQPQQEISIDDPSSMAFRVPAFTGRHAERRRARPRLPTHHPAVIFRYFSAIFRFFDDFSVLMPPRPEMRLMPIALFA